MLWKFDIRYTSIEEILCQYFYKELRPSIRLSINEKGQKLDDYSALIKKATTAEAKTKIQIFVSPNINQHFH